MIRKLAAWLMSLLGVLTLLLAASWWWGEARWGRLDPLAPQQAFEEGTLGLELAPLKYMLTLSTVSPQAFDRGDGRSWPRAFGFLLRAQSAPACAASGTAALPHGFSIARRLPGSATPIPYEFVGLTCAACHSAEVRSGEQRTFVLGAGSYSADVIAFSDALLNAVSDPELTGAKILDAYERQCPDDRQPWPLRQAEVLMYDLWLSSTRSAFALNYSKYDLPFHGHALGDPALIPTGPSRTRPFRSVVRNALDLPGAGNLAYSKVPLVAGQHGKTWSQFDGSIHDPVVRSMIAVYTSGASIAGLAEPQIEHNVRTAAAYTLHLGAQPRLPTLAQRFPDLPHPDPTQLQQGRELYRAHCHRCHGGPAADGGWEHADAAQYECISPVVADATPTPRPACAVPSGLGTDSARVDFRYAAMLPLALPAKLPGAGDQLQRQREGLQRGQQQAQADGRLAEAQWFATALKTLESDSRQFPAGHPLSFEPEDIRRTPGFINSSLQSVWLRAPYLHNASVPTLRQLLGLDPRPQRFCRGDNEYDPVAVGLHAPAWEPGGACPPEQPFRYDTAMPGNSSEGHWYPWPYAEAQVRRTELEALLAYLRTF